MGANLHHITFLHPQTLGRFLLLDPTTVKQESQNANLVGHYDLEGSME
jgi:hypothetical protein